MKSKDLRKEMRFGSLLQRLLLAYAPDQHVTAFRSKIGQGTLAGLIDNTQRIRGSTTTEIQYQQALTQFRKSPSPPGHVLDWVCRDDGDYLGQGSGDDRKSESGAHRLLQVRTRTRVLNRQLRGDFERWHLELRAADDCARMAA
jgi:hypothetical protein